MLKSSGKPLLYLKKYGQALSLNFSNVSFVIRVNLLHPEPSLFLYKNYLASFTLQNILNSLRQVTKDRTSIFIAHRLSTVVDADEILVLEEGRVRERGSHYSLITDSNSLYAHLWHKQHEAHKAEIDRTQVNDGTSAAGM